MVAIDILLAQVAVLVHYFVGGLVAWWGTRYHRDVSIIHIHY